MTDEACPSTPRIGIFKTSVRRDPRHVADELNVRGESSPRHDPYRFWVSGILVELGAFIAFALTIIIATVVIVSIYGG